MLVDLSLVTKALVTLLREGVRISEGWNGSTPTVSPLPPDQMTADALGLYLYHVAEDGHYKNLPAPSGNRVPVRQTPMALQLFYQLSAQSPTPTEVSVYTAQQLMGCAVKVLHDHPVVDDTTTVDTTVILDSAGLSGSGNLLRIVLQPVAQNEAVNYWTAGTGPTRLAAYYQVGAILMDPEPQETRSGRVISYGIQLFTTGTPRLNGSRNLLGFTGPTGQAVTVELRPAQVPFDGAFSLLGTGLTGDQIGISLRSSGWTAAESVDTVDWGVAATSDTVTARVRERAGGQVVLPGTYDAAVEVTRFRTDATGTRRAFKQRSNVVPIQITPRVDAAAVFAPDTVTISGHVFQDAGILPGAVEVYLGADRLAKDEDLTLTPGEFIITNATQIDLRAPASLERGVPQPLRVLVNGAESAPLWVTLP